MAANRFRALTILGAIGFRSRKLLLTITGTIHYLRHACVRRENVPMMLVKRGADESDTDEENRVVGPGCFPRGLAHVFCLVLDGGKPD